VPGRPVGHERRSGLPCRAGHRVAPVGVRTVIPYNRADSVVHARRTRRDLTKWITYSARSARLRQRDPHERIRGRPVSTNPGYAVLVFAAGGSSLHHRSGSIRARLHVRRSPFSALKVSTSSMVSLSPEVDREGSSTLVALALGLAPAFARRGAAGGAPSAHARARATALRRRAGHKHPRPPVVGPPIQV
jgi:hypothetical protein